MIGFVKELGIFDLKARAALCFVIPLVIFFVAPASAVVLLEDDFDPDIDTAMWSALNNASANQDCGSVSGNAMKFAGDGERSATTINLCLGSGVIEFWLKIGTGDYPCEDADGGEEVVLEYSTCGSGIWTQINRYGTGGFPEFTPVAEDIPADAAQLPIRLRWRQLRHSGSNFDHWAIDNVIISGEGSCITCGGLPLTICGTDGNDVFRGTDGPDVIHGLGGNDVIQGLGGDDVICGGAGNDTIRGNDGDDELYGGIGHDHLLGGPGNDRLLGEWGSDTLSGGPDDDELNGGPGHDNLWGGVGSDTLFGGSGNDSLDGGPGNDELYGQQGNDSLYGKAGDDDLYGGGMTDCCYGGADTDTADECEFVKSVP